MRPSPALLVASLAALAALVVLGFSGTAMRGVVSAGPVRIDADAGPRPDDALRARSYAVDPGVPADVRDWLAAALTRVRPEARRLIDAVDGQITVRVHASDGLAAGFVQPTPEGFVLSLDADGLRRQGDEIRDHVIAHELGHVVDLALVPADLNASLDVGVPRIGGCEGDGVDAGCASAEERFADTFAKWALDDPVVLAGPFSVGYRVAPPANLALWGEPLQALEA